MVSFDIVSLFTAIPVEKACERIHTKLETDVTLTSRTKLTIDSIISLLCFTLTNSFFTHNSTIYKQVHGCAMGKPVSPLIANLYMEEIEECAITNTANPPKEWDCYVDDVFSIMKKDAVSTFHNELNSIDPHISFTIEHETDRQIAFTISHISGTITTNVYRKPTHIDRYLDFKLHHDKKRTISTFATLLHRTTSTPNTAEGKAIETKKVVEALMSNGYPRKFITDIQKRQRKTDTTPEPEELVHELFALVDPPTSIGYAVLSYIKDLTEPLARVLQKYDIKFPTSL